MFPWPVRVFVLWPLAAVQLVLLSMSALGFEYSVPFEDFLRWLGDEFASFFAPVEVAIRTALAWFAITLPPLGAHWHHAFVLLWLMFGSMARMFAGFAEPAPLLSRSWFRKVMTEDTPTLLWAAFCALVPSILVGMRPVEHAAVAVWPIAGLFLFIAGMMYSVGWRWWALAPVVLAFTMIMGTSPKPIGDVIGIVTSSPGVFTLVIVVGAVGILLAAAGAVTGKTWRERLINPSTVTGLDILGVYAVALTLGAIGKYLV